MKTHNRLLKHSVDALTNIIKKYDKIWELPNFAANCSYFVLNTNETLLVSTFSTDSIQIHQKKSSHNLLFI